MSVLPGAAGPGKGRMKGAFFLLIANAQYRRAFQQYVENCSKKYLAAQYNCLSLQPDLKSMAGGRVIE